MSKYKQVLLKRGNKTQVANVIIDMFCDGKIKEGNIIKIANNEKCNCVCACKIWKIEKVYKGDIELEYDPYDEKLR